jgi:hypothetical protein
MGTAASQRRMKRMKYLAKVAKDEPERFDFEWDKRLSSWLDIIRKDAGRLNDRKNGKVSPVFDIITEALRVLESCGETTYRKHAKETFDILSNECCRLLAGHIDPRLFRLNNYARLDMTL